MTDRHIDFRNLERARRRRPSLSKPWEITGALHDLADALVIAGEIAESIPGPRADEIIEYEWVGRIGIGDLAGIAKAYREAADAWQEEIDAVLTDEAPA